MVLPPILVLVRHGYRYTSDINACRNHSGCTLLEVLRNGNILQVGCECRSLADGRVDISLDDKVPCFSIEAAADASLDERTFIVKRNNCDERSESSPLMSEVTVIEKTDVTLRSVGELLEKEAKESFWNAAA